LEYKYNFKSNCYDPNPTDDPNLVFYSITCDNEEIESVSSKDGRTTSLITPKLGFVGLINCIYNVIDPYSAISNNEILL